MYLISNRLIQFCSLLYQMAYWGRRWSRVWLILPLCTVWECSMRHYLQSYNEIFCSNNGLETDYSLSGCHGLVSKWKGLISVISENVRKAKKHSSQLNDTSVKEANTLLWLFSEKGGKISMLLCLGLLQFQMEGCVQL